MIHPDDANSLRRILGIDDSSIPPDVEAEYSIRANAYHRDGNSGPLRTLALIDLTRYLGLAPPNVAKKTAPVDWRQFPHDGSTRVEAYFFGAWMPGVYLGFVESGTLAVRLDTTRSFASAAGTSCGSPKTLT